MRQKPQQTIYAGNYYNVRGKILKFTRKNIPTQQIAPSHKQTRRINDTTINTYEYAYEDQ
jgi:hypothetical protein